MRTKVKKEMHTKTAGELKELVKQGRSELFTLTMDYTQRKLKDTAAIKRKRKDIAILLTVLKEKESINENV